MRPARLCEASAIISVLNSEIENWGQGRRPPRAESDGLCLISHRLWSPMAIGPQKWYQIQLSTGRRCSFSCLHPRSGQIRFPGNLDLLCRSSFRSRRPSPAHRLPVGGGHRHSMVSAPASSPLFSSRRLGLVWGSCSIVAESSNSESLLRAQQRAIRCSSWVSERELSA